MPKEYASKGKKKEQSKSLPLFCEMFENAWKKGNKMIIIFSSEKWVFNDFRVWMIPGWNMSSLNFWSLKARKIKEGSITPAKISREEAEWN